MDTNPPIDNGEEQEDEVNETAQRAPFGKICSILESIMVKKTKEAKRAKLRAFLDEWRLSKDSFHPSLRLLLPHLDKERTSYGMKESTLAKAYIGVLGLAKNSQDAEMLLHYKLPEKTQGRPAGDFPNVLKEVVGRRSNVRTPTVSIAEINSVLDRLNVSDKNKESQHEIVKWFFTHCTPDEQKWIVRIILKDLKIGFSENAIFDLFNPDAKELFNRVSSLRQVAKQLPTYETRLDNMEIALFTPFRPMIAGRAVSLKSIPVAMGGRTFYIQTKLDGERMLMHKDGGAYKWFSRNQTNYTAECGASKHDSGVVVKEIDSLFNPKVRSIILDGEMMVYDKQVEGFGKFGHLKTAYKDRLENGDNAILHPCYVVFDVLYLNGRTLVSEPLADRIDLLKKVLTPRQTFLEILPFEEANSAEDIATALNQHMVRQEEGLMIKDPKSAYTPSSKRGSSWLKVKPDYLDSLANDLDLLLVGGCYGEGNRGGNFASFMLGVIDDSVPPRNGIPVIHTFAKVGTGFSMDQIPLIVRDPNLWSTYDPRRPPPWLVHPPNSKEKPDKLILPSTAQVIKVKGAEIVRSDVYGFQWTIRFPRFVEIREDKKWDEAMTLKQLQEFVEQYQGRLQSRIFGEAAERDVDNRIGKKRKRVGTTVGPRQRVSAKVDALYMGADLKGVEKEDELFAGLEVCVSGDAASRESATGMDGGFVSGKHELELLLAKHGGRCVQNPTNNTKVVIADRQSIRIGNLIQAGTHDIVTSTWIFDSVQKKQVIPLVPRYMIFATASTKKSFRETVDLYGDSFTEELTSTGIRELFHNMNVDDLLADLAEGDDSVLLRTGEQLPQSLQMIHEIHQRYFSMTKLPCSIFRHGVRQVIAYVDLYKSVRVSPDLLLPNSLARNSKRDSLERAAAAEALLSNAGFKSIDSNPGAEIVHDEVKVAGSDRIAPDSALELIRSQLEFYGAVVLDRLTPFVTHIIVDEAELNARARKRRAVDRKGKRRAEDVRVEEGGRGWMLRKLLAMYPERYGGIMPLAKVVSAQWVRECIKEKTVLDEDRFAAD
ncbi:ATP dependent DNA ligase domain-containing protein [Cladochytrium replicatum]|nr:ATP dependent DNA ligase domain-containing protein [Cladochytrium replicatum]